MSFLVTVCGLSSLVAGGGDAAAQGQKREYRVRITSTPPGATVYVDDRDAGPVGETPYDTKLTAGKHTIYIELTGHVPLAKDIDVRPRDKRQTFSFGLDELENGSIEVVSSEDGAADGGEVRIDGEKVGVVPDLFDVPEGEHVVEVVKDGYQTYKKTITVRKGSPEAVVVQLAGAAAEKLDPTSDPVEDPEPVVRTPARPAAGAPLIVLGAGLGAGTRSVEYEHEQPDEPDLRNFDLPIAGLAHVAAELRLGRLHPALRHAAVFGQFFISVPIESSTDDGTEVTSTLWLRREVGLRYALPVGPLRVVAEAAEGGDALTFGGFDETVTVMDEDGNLIERATLPDVTYEYVRGGIGVGARVAEIDIHAQVDGILVFAAGDQIAVFADTTQKDIAGLGARLVARRRLASRVDATASVSLMRFVYEIAGRGMADPAIDGGVDQMIEFGLAAGYSF